MTIVVGYVPTPEGGAALSRAGDEARAHDARLVVVSSTKGESHVAAPHVPTSQLPLSLAALRSAGVDCEVRELEQSRDAAGGILAVADEVEASMIVIGLKRRSAVGKLLLGSTSQRILFDAKCPVLCVRP